MMLQSCHHMIIMLIAEHLRIFLGKWNDNFVHRSTICLFATSKDVNFSCEHVAALRCSSHFFFWIEKISDFLLQLQQKPTYQSYNLRNFSARNNMIFLRPDDPQSCEDVQLVNCDCAHDLNNWNKCDQNQGKHVEPWYNAMQKSISGPKQVSAV
jgi:hypothetical protein